MNAHRLAVPALVTALLGSSAAADDLVWAFQRTGFRTGSSVPQTALAMRSNQSWPVVFGIDQDRLNAYSLFPVLNRGQVPIGPPTNWHQIGTNLTGSVVPSSSAFLQAASGSPDGFAVSVQTPFPPQATPPDAVVVGTSLTGFQPPVTGAQAVKFDDDGDPFIATAAMISGQFASDKLFDVAISKFGAIGAVTQSAVGVGEITFWQQSPLLAGQWLSSPIVQGGRSEPPLFGPTVDLAYDSSSRPHVIGVNRIIPNNTILAYRFDITTGAWVGSTLDTGSLGSPPIQDVAAASNDDGIVGAAWVNGGVLKYAYMDTTQPTLNWVVTSVASLTPNGTPLERSQGVGLAFDNSGLPVISFVEQGNRQIWIAYDPPVLGVPAAPPLAGDFTGDGFVDGGDLGEWTVAFGDGSSTADADADGDTDGADFLAWQRNVSGGSATTLAAAVPEPAALSMVLTAMVVVFGGSRRQADRHLN